MTQIPSTPLAPVSPQVKARHKRQNRVIIAVVVLVLVPVFSIGIANRYVDSVMDAWTSHPTFPFNTSIEVDLDSGTDYVVWTYFGKASCTVAFDGQPVATYVPPAQAALETQGIYQSVGFSAPATGAYSVACAGDAPGGYAMVSTPSPVGTIAVARLLGYAGVAVGVIAGLVLLILALVTNAEERKATYRLDE